LEEKAKKLEEENKAKELEEKAKELEEENKAKELEEKAKELEEENKAKELKEKRLSFDFFLLSVFGFFFSKALFF
jgi:F0F1-type ATP synthase assembly protein I